MAQTEQVPQRTEARDGMHVDWHVPIPMDDGVVLRADVFRPIAEGRYPAIVSYGPYAKGLAFQDGYAPQWQKMVADHPDVAEGSSNLYQNWEVADPEKWVPDGYVCVRADSRGAGWSPGKLDVFSPRETQDFAAVIEWVAEQPWSSGKVGLLGISYYAINQWLVAGLAPPHLTAMVAWEGAADFYREMTYHGGILSEFCANWYPRQVETVQHGLGERAAVSRVTGERVTGPDQVAARTLRRNRADLPADIEAHRLDDEWHQARSAEWAKVTVPFLSAANWGGQGLHPRGNIEAFTQAASVQKWLEVHGGEHWSHFYTDYGVGLQKRFFDHFLRAADNGWDRQPPVQLQVRHVDRFVERHEHEWPLARTDWTRYYLDLGGKRLDVRPPGGPARLTYDPLGDGVDFWSASFEAETEITGPIAARLWCSSATSDADLFLVVRVFDPDGEEVVFQGALDPNTPVAQGWLRASHRRLDPERSLPWRPYHTHDAVEPLTPGEVYPLDVEIWPTCIVIPAGYQLVLSVRGRDYEYGGELDEFARSFHFASRGCGPFVHDSPQDRPRDVFGGEVTLHSQPGREPYLLLPVIPPA
ncbi:MAG: CocE/NonD family hydrolase [bacterium]|jgi:predicted acyl esterase|nr:CocE/NonD family hydrolase [bacterium]